jgi:hypothetical protein
MGNEDAGDDELHPAEKQRPNEEKSEFGSDILIEREGGNVVDVNVDIEQLTFMNPRNPIANDHGIVPTRPSATAVVDEAAHINDEPGTRPLDGVNMQESEVQDLDHVSAPSTLLCRSTSSKYAAMLRMLSPRHHQQRASGNERMNRPRLGNSNERRGGNTTIISNEPNAPQSQGAHLVQAHLVQPESASRGPFVEAKSW